MSFELPPVRIKRATLHKICCCMSVAMLKTCIHRTWINQGNGGWQLVLDGAMSVEVCTRIQSQKN